ncbi:MAG: TIM barrel protein, partial [Nanoarchaeota archaeon]|nr:TIM barrel protein [Nanoarchaeota archaeon]
VEQKQHLDRPLFVAPEGWQTESYGSHPKEMRELIEASRAEMAKRLMDQKKAESQDEAEKIAADHIKGTLDVGHINNWRKHFQGSDDDFNKWLVDNVKEMVKGDKPLLGNIHLSDNFGYHDEHLRVGEGNAPITELLKGLEKEGYKGHYIAEPGGQKQGQFHTAWTHALGLADSPIYRTDRTSRSWTDISGSYFGNTPGPNYLVGEGVVPSKEFTLWSQVPLE